MFFLGVGRVRGNKNDQLLFPKGREHNAIESK